MLWLRGMGEGNAGQDYAARFAAMETHPSLQGPAVDGKIIAFCHR